MKENEFQQAVLSFIVIALLFLVGAFISTLEQRGC